MIVNHMVTILNIHVALIVVGRGHGVNHVKFGLVTVALIMEHAYVLKLWGYSSVGRAILRGFDSHYLHQIF